MWKLSSPAMSSSDSSSSDSSDSDSSDSGSGDGSFLRLFFSFFGASSSSSPPPVAAAAFLLAFLNQMWSSYRDSRCKSPVPSSAPTSMNVRAIRFIVAASNRTCFASSASSTDSGSAKAGPPSAPSRTFSKTCANTRLCKALFGSSWRSCAQGLSSASVACGGTGRGVGVTRAFLFSPFLRVKTVRGAPPFASFSLSGSHPISTSSLPDATFRISVTNTSARCRRKPTSTTPWSPLPVGMSADRMSISPTSPVIASAQSLSAQ